MQSGTKKNKQFSLFLLNSSLSNYPLQVMAAEAIRFKDILEVKKKTDQLLQTDALRRNAAEARMQ